MSSDRDAERSRLLLEGNLTCSTCVHAEVGRCCACGVSIPLDEQDVEVDWPEPSSVFVDGKEVSGVLHLRCQHCFDRIGDWATACVVPSSPKVGYTEAGKAKLFTKPWWRPECG